MGGRARSRRAGRIPGTRKIRPDASLTDRAVAAGGWHLARGASGGSAECFRAHCHRPARSHSARSSTARAAGSGKRWCDDGPGRRWFRPAASQRTHNAGPRLRHGGVVAPARRAAAGRSVSRWLAHHPAVLLHRTFAARPPRLTRPVEPQSGPWTFAGVGGERRSGQGNFSGGGCDRCGVSGGKIMTLGPPLLLAFMALATSIAAGFRLPRTWLVLTVTGTVIGVVAALRVLLGGENWEWQSGFLLGGELLHLRLDGLSAMFLMRVSVVGGTGAVYSREYWSDHHNPASAPRGRAWWSALLVSIDRKSTRLNSSHA